MRTVPSSSVRWWLHHCFPHHYNKWRYSFDLERSRACSLCCHTKAHTHQWHTSTTTTRLLLFVSEQQNAEDAAEIRFKTIWLWHTHTHTMMFTTVLLIVAVVSAACLSHTGPFWWIDREEDGRILSSRFCNQTIKRCERFQCDMEKKRREETWTDQEASFSSETPHLVSRPALVSLSVCSRFQFVTDLSFYGLTRFLQISVSCCSSFWYVAAFFLFQQHLLKHVMRRWWASVIHTVTKSWGSYFSSMTSCSVNNLITITVNLFEGHLPCYYRARVLCSTAIQAIDTASQQIRHLLQLAIKYRHWLRRDWCTCASSFCLWSQEPHINL